MKTIATTFADIGATEFFPLEQQTAERIALHFYDVVDLTTTLQGNQPVLAVKTASGWSALVGSIKHPSLGIKPAILHKTEPRRLIEFLEP